MVLAIEYIAQCGDRSQHCNPTTSRERVIVSNTLLDGTKASEYVLGGATSCDSCNSDDRMLNRNPFDRISRDLFLSAVV